MMRARLNALAAAAFAAGAAAQPAPPGPLAPAAVPLTLAQAHATALQNHPGIAAANYQAQAEQQVFVQARAGLLPQLNAYGSAVHADSDNTRLMAGGLNNPSVFSRTAIGGTLSQLITDFGHSTNLAASTRLRASAADQNALLRRAAGAVD
jgi:outer membrane protein